MQLQNLVDAIINNTNYNIDCHGLQAADAAEAIAKHYFTEENIPFDGWIVREIPLVDNSGKYPVAVVICVTNETEEKEIALNITRDGKLFSVNPDEMAQIDLNSITEAIAHPAAKYGEIN